ncbi:MAG: hypothetical protein ABW217_20735 [Polyangiaceae bacterium]
MRQSAGWAVTLGFVLGACPACLLDKVNAVDSFGSAGSAAANGGASGSGGDGSDASVANGAGGSTDIDQQLDSGLPLGPPTLVQSGLAPAKLDLLFMIDNSISMQDKQNLLDLTNLNVLGRLSNPDCVGADRTRTAMPDAEAPCPEGQQRAFRPITDVHVGIITSSLGDSGANEACVAPETQDMGRLIGTLRGPEQGADGAGFLAWRAGDNLATLNQSFQRMLRAVGESGCGYEMSLESWYRFLIDPAPYLSLERVACTPEETALNCRRPLADENGRVALDEALLAQRAAFLRPDSLLAIVMLTDENDCSVRFEPQSWVVVSTTATVQPMYRGSPTCEVNPNHFCCYLCVLGPPEGCEAEPVCDEGTRLAQADDGPNLRCLDQRRRFGYDFLYPTERYVNALREPELCLSDAALNEASCAAEELVANPLFVGDRAPQDVFLAGIVGVPWQRLEASVGADGDALAANVLRFKSAGELADGTWEQILGAPRDTPPEPPADPFMRESTEPRPGIEPGNPINGAEYDTVRGIFEAGPNDLQFACTSPLPQPRSCEGALPETCDCAEPIEPLCSEQPGVSTPGTTQYFAKAYPGLRQLDVLRDLGDNSIVASICARNVSDAARPDFAYRPAFDAIAERLSRRLRPVP